MANRGERIADGRALNPIRMGMGCGTQRLEGRRGRAAEHALLRSEGGLRNIKGRKHPANRARQQRTVRAVGEWKTRTAGEEEAGARLEVANHRPLRTAGGSAALLGILGVSEGAC